MSLKERFIKECENCECDPKYLIVAVKLSSGAIELITNSDQIGNKAEYYKNAYDDEFRLKSNPEIQIINYMLVQEI